MRIGFVTQWFPPEPGIVASAIADGLASRGHDVHVLTGFPNYPSGRLQPGYPLRPYQREERSARVTVHRAPLYPSHDRFAAKRVLNYASFALAASVIARTRMPAPDVWLVYSSPATAAIPALITRRRHKIPTYLLIQDLWPDSVTGSGLVGRGPPIRAVDGVLSRYCQWTYARSAGIGVISPSMRAILEARGVDGRKIYFTPNWAQPADGIVRVAQAEAERHRLGLPAGLLFVYTGNIGALQGLGPLLDAFAECRSANLVLIGDGVERVSLMNAVARRAATNVHFLPSQPLSQIGAYIAAADVQVISLRDTPLLRATMPSKVQVALASARPLLVHAAGDVADLVTTTQTGIAAMPGDMNAAIDAINQFASMSPNDRRRMGDRARRSYDELFSSEAGLDRLEDMIRAP